jgi:hypothetical protein
MEVTMAKRSDFARRPMDDYATPAKAVLPLLPHLEDVHAFAEPCWGDGALVRHLMGHGLWCSWQSDIRQGRNGLDLTGIEFAGADAIITNPPWTFRLMDPLLRHFLQFKPVWFLLSADYAHNIQSAWSMDRCSHMVAIGRVKWMAGSRHAGKDNACWYRFQASHRGGPRFYPRILEPGLLELMEAA